MGTISKKPAATSFQFETEAAGCSEKSVSTYRTARCYNIQDYNTNPSTTVNTAVWACGDEGEEHSVLTLFPNTTSRSLSVVCLRPSSLFFPAFKSPPPQKKMLHCDLGSALLVWNKHFVKYSNKNIACVIFTFTLRGLIRKIVYVSYSKERTLSFSAHRTKSGH